MGVVKQVWELVGIISHTHISGSATSRYAAQSPGVTQSYKTSTTAI